MKSGQPREPMFADSLVERSLKKLAAVGNEPVAEGLTGEERELRHQYAVDVATAVCSSVGQMPAVIRALRFQHPEKKEDERYGMFASGIAMLLRLDPDDFIRHVLARAKGQHLAVGRLKE